MKFKVGDLPKSESFDPGYEGWHKTREPQGIWIYQLLAIPIGIILVALAYIFSIYLLGVQNPLGGSLLLPIITIIPIHELLHASVFPNLFSSSTIIGIYPKGLAFYAYYEGEMKRNRWILVTIMPILVITCFPLLLMYVIKVQSLFIVQVSILNILFACVDILGFFIVLFQIPVKAVVRNKGIKTYWIVRGN